MFGKDKEKKISLEILKNKKINVINTIISKIVIKTKELEGSRKILFHEKYYF